MAGWSIRSVVIAAALASAASTPVWAQQGWAPPAAADDGWQQSPQDYDAPPAGDDQTSPGDRVSGNDRWSNDDAPAQDDATSRYSDRDTQSSGDSDSTSYHGGFASRDAVPPDSAASRPAPHDEADGWGTWRSNPAPADPGAPPASADEDALDAHPAQAPGTVNSFNQPDTTPGFAATTGIDNRNQAVSGCLAAVRSRVGGGAGAARVDGINGEWMVSGAIADGRAFYCSIRHGAIDDVQFGS